MNKEKDIFDKIMALPILNIFEPFYKKYKELLLYLFFGVLAFVVSITSYVLFDVVFKMNELIANILSWICAVSFAYITNRVWVFRAPTNSIAEFLKQLFAFFSGRVVTLIIEELILLCFVTLLDYPSITVKIIAQIIVIVLNYIISKLFVF